MIDLDNGPLAMLLWVLVVYTFPFIYSFMVDKTDQGKPDIKSYGWFCQETGKSHVGYSGMAFLHLIISALP